MRLEKGKGRNARSLPMFLASAASIVAVFAPVGCAYADMVERSPIPDWLDEVLPIGIVVVLLVCAAAVSVALIATRRNKMSQDIGEKKIFEQRAEMRTGGKSSDEAWASPSSPEQQKS